MMTTPTHAALTRPAPGQPTQQQRTGPRLRPFRTPVRGHAFAASPPGSRSPHPGAVVRLVREPHNPADPLAVAVWLDGETERSWRIGYLDRGVAARVAPRLDGGLALAARVDGWIAEPGGQWRRPVVLLLPESADTEVPEAEPVTTPAPGTDTVEQADDGSGAARRPDPRAATGTVGRGLWGRPPGVSRRVIGPSEARRPSST